MEIDNISLREPFGSFGLQTATLSATMPGLHMKWNGRVVIVTHDNRPGIEAWVFPGEVKKIVWSEPKPEVSDAG